MDAWWSGLEPLNRAFWLMAVFFSAIFAWQFISALSSVGDGADHHLGGGGDHGGGHMGGDHGGGGHADVGHGDAMPAHYDHVLGHDHDLSPQGHVAADQVAGQGTDQDDLANDSAGVTTFKLLSVRSVLAFAMLFSWAGALYLQQSVFASLALLRAALWGVAGMVVVAAFFWALPRLTEEGTSNLDTAIGRIGQVYMNIPEGGVGQIKVIVSGALQFVRARTTDGRFLPAGTAVRVVRRLDTSTLEVEEAEA